MESMKEAFRQTAIVGVSCVITIMLWLGIRLLLHQAQIQTSKVIDYILVILIYTAIRLGIKSLVVPKQK